jgi:hypothetical protein
MLVRGTGVLRHQMFHCGTIFRAQLRSRAFVEQTKNVAFSPLPIQTGKYQLTGAHAEDRRRGCVHDGDHQTRIH